MEHLRAKTLIPPLAGLMALCAGAPAGAQEARDSVSDALAGHRAEMQQLGENPDPMRRAMYFDPVDIESQPAGVPCDHVVRRRPEASAGRGWVVLLQADDAPKRLVRVWFPPAGPTSESEAVAQARVFAAGRVKNAEFAVLGARAFAWCK